MIIITKNINDVRMIGELIGDNSIILDTEMIQKDRQRVFDQVRDNKTERGTGQAVNQNRHGRKRAGNRRDQ